MPDLTGLAAVLIAVAVGAAPGLVKDFFAARREDVTRFAQVRRELYAQFVRKANERWHFLAEQPVSKTPIPHGKVPTDRLADLQDLYWVFCEIRIVGSPEVVNSAFRVYTALENIWNMNLGRVLPNQTGATLAPLAELSTFVAAARKELRIQGETDDVRL